MISVRTDTSRPHLVIVGSGMAGVACLEEILKHPPRFTITLIGDETHASYNRILLSSVLAGERSADDIALNPLEWYHHHGVGLRLGTRATAIDPDRQTVTTDDGRVTRFDRLVVATGSAPVLPPIEGLDLEGVLVFRTLDDTRALLRRAGPGINAAVVGGGLLGLEAAYGLHAQGCTVTVVHLAATLMERQLDAAAGSYLQTHLERLGIRVRLNRETRAIRGEGRVQALTFADGGQLEADLVVVATGIRPNTDLAREAGLAVNRGILVDDHLQTSHPDIFALGECVEHRGICYGLVAPLREQSRILAATLTGHPDAAYEGTLPASRLKVAGLDVFSAGDWTDAPDADAMRYDDPAMNVYRKVVLRDGRLAGVILVGETSDSHRYMDWLRASTALPRDRRELLFPSPTDDGLDVAAMADRAIVCGCVGVTKGTIIESIHARGVTTLAQLKEATRAATGCGSCTGLCQALLKAVAPAYEEAVEPVLCACIPFPQDRLREILRTQQLRSVQEVLEIYGNGVGCEICKPALSYLLDMVWCGEHDEDRSARFINDRVHANIQKDGTFSVVPRMRGGVTSPAELRRIADAAEKYQVRMVKITGSQRIDLLGVKKADLPKIWADLDMPSGQAYTKGVRMVKTCVGTEFCRFAVQDSTRAGIELERRLEHLQTPHKVKMASVGCPRNCAEATVKDIGLVGQEGQWQVVVGGAAGKTVRKADLLITVETTEAALEAAEIFFQYYREHGHYLERTYDFVARVGMETIRKETVYAGEPVKQALLDRLRKSKARARDAWALARAAPPTPFIPLHPIDEVIA
jgi:nitrite reductase (NADH) large subunit